MLSPHPRVSLFGPPHETEAVAQLAPTGVDAQMGIQSRHAGDVHSVLTSSLVADGSLAGQGVGLRRPPPDPRPVPPLPSRHVAPAR